MFKNNLKEIILVDKIPYHSARIPLKAIEQSRYFHSLHEKAQQYARHIVDQANKKCDTLYANAFLEGFERALTITLQDLLIYVNDSEQLTKKITQQLCQHLTQELTTFFDEDEVIYRLINKLTLEIESRPADKLVLILPKKYNALSSRLLKLFSSKQIQLEIKSTNLSNITIEHNKIIWNCPIPDIVDMLTRNTITSLLNQKNMAYEHKTIIFNSLMNFQQTLKQQCQQIKKEIYPIE